MFARRRFFLAIVLALVAGIPAHADEKADEILIRCALAYDAHPRLRANVQSTSRWLGGDGCSGHIIVSRPWRARLEWTSATPSCRRKTLQIADGTAEQTYVNGEPVSYRSVGAIPANDSIGPRDMWLCLFFDPISLLRPTGPNRDTQLLGKEKVGDDECDRVRITQDIKTGPPLLSPWSSQEVMSVTDVYVGPDGLARRIVVKSTWRSQEMRAAKGVDQEIVTDTTFKYVEQPESEWLDPSEFIIPDPMMDSRHARKGGASQGAQAMPGETQLITAIVGEDASEVKALLKRGSSPNEADRNGLTPLMRAAALGSFHTDESADIVTELLNAGANVNAVSHSGGTALLAALHPGRSKVAMLLLAHGADPNLGTQKYFSPLIKFAAYFVGAEVNAALLDAHADPDAADEAGVTPLMSVWRGDVAEAFLAHSAKPDLRDHAGHTALTIAADHGRTGVVRALLKHGADPNLAGPGGVTALAVAQKHGFADIVDLLQSAVKPKSP